MEIITLTMYADIILSALATLFILTYFVSRKNEMGSIAIAISIIITIIFIAGLFSIIGTISMGMYQVDTFTNIFIVAMTAMLIFLREEFFENIKITWKEITNRHQ